MRSYRCVFFSTLRFRNYMSTLNRPNSPHKIGEIENKTIFVQLSARSFDWCYFRKILKN